MRRLTTRETNAVSGDSDGEARRRKWMGRAMVIGLGVLVLLYLAATFVR